MSIPASDIVAINPGILAPGGKDLQLNGVHVTESDLIPPGTVLSFPSPTDAAAYFGDLSPQAAFAGKYFLGYDNSPAKPRTLFYGRWLLESAAPKVEGVRKHAVLAELQAMNAGTLTLSMGAITVALTALDFTLAATFSDCADVVQTAMIAAAQADPHWLAATCTYDGVKANFIIGSTLTGMADITTPTGTAANAMGLSEGVVFLGADMQTPTQCMNAIAESQTNWVTFSVALTAAELTDEQNTEFAQWSNDRGVRFLYCLYSIDSGLLLPETPNIGTILQDLEYSGVAGEYGDVSYVAFLQGLVASIDFDRPGGAITTAFKSQDGLGFNIDNGTNAALLEIYGFNYYGDWATANDNFKFHYPGQMFGRYVWIDTYVNAIWLNNALQVANMAGLKGAGRVPYNAKGYTSVRAWMQDPINRALANGVIDVGVTLSELQKAEVNRQAGLNIADRLEDSGYYLQILDPAPAIRGRRESPIINLWYTYGGSVQKLEIASTAVV